VTDGELPRLPTWKRGTPAVLCAGGAPGPHPIPVSTVVRAGDHRILLALGSRRATLDRLRDEPRAALCVMGAGVAFTAHCVAAVLDARIEAAQDLAVVELRVEGVQDHLADGRTEMLDGARWRWREERFAEGDRVVFDALERLAG
jgi:hypothetical protein